MQSMTRPLILRFGLAAALAAASAGCGMIKTAAVKSVADTLADPKSDVFTRDDDPELVRRAAPFGLKLYESLLDSVPTYEPLLIATCSNFTEYSYAFVEGDADLVRADDHARAKALDAEALKLYVRAKTYCLRGMEVRFKGVTKALMQDDTRAKALAKAEKKDVPLLYWTAASWGSAISLGLDQPDLAVDFPTVRALAERALALDPDWGNGALQELMITIESISQLGGSADKAREHFARAVDIQQGLDAGPYLDLALGVSVNAQDRAEFEKLLKEAIAVDPDKDPHNRLVNLINQRRAEALLDHADYYFAKAPEN
jgi:predicted anti-sigma-YlaC factor YlaD